MYLRPIQIVLAVFCLAPAPAASAQKLTLESVNGAAFAAAATEQQRAVIVKAQILLDRARFSPGVIDGHKGENFRKALAAFQRERALADSGKLDAATWAALAQGSDQPAMIEYEIKRADADAKFVKKIPATFEAQAKLERLAYTGPRELLAEKFHMAEDLLKAFNPKASFARAGLKIAVANIRGDAPKGRAARVEVHKAGRTVRAIAKDGALLAFYPATVGSVEKPAPSGEYKVRAIAVNPLYRYNPDYNFKGVKSKEPLKIAPGPNNPVGSIWIDLTAESYGIHGTPSPEKVSKTESHGCVRLTNWDAEELSKMVSKGTPVVFVE